MVVAHAIAEVSGDRRGIHVLFSGPPAWLYAPGGFTIERRLWQRPKGRRLCADLRDTALAQLHRERELETPIGLATLRDGTWQHPSGGAPGTAEVLTVDLREPTPMATVAMPGPNWTAWPEPSEAPGTDMITRCLEILQRIGDGFDSRATGPDRMRAAALREQHLAATSPRDPLRDLIESWTPEELEEEFESLRAEND